MATVEKPKQKKKKLIKKNADTQADNYNLTDSSFLPVSTKKYDESTSSECVISSEFKLLTVSNTKIENIEKTCKTNENVQISHPSQEYEFSMLDNTSPLETVYPSAPIKEETSKRAEAMNFDHIELYPNLNDMKYQNGKRNNQSSITFKIQKSEVLPYTRSQLKNFYYCKHIEEAQSFENLFLINYCDEKFSSNALFFLLNQYLQIRSKLRVNLMDISNLTVEIAALEQSIWFMQEQSKEFKGTCGDNLTAVGIAKYEIACIDQRRLEIVSSLNVQIHELVCSTYTSNLVEAGITKYRIEQIVREISADPIFQKGEFESNSRNQNSINHLRTAVSIFFSFLRKPNQDEIFTIDVRTWLIQLVAAQLKIATSEDHWFLLFHLMRCPSGIALWGKSIIQLPFLNDQNIGRGLVNHEVDHCMAVLNILLSRIKNRNEFLRARTEAHKDIFDPVKDDIWILIDSDGEEDGTPTGDCIALKENDMISLFNQIPLDLFFSSIFNIEKKGESYHIYTDTLTANQLLKLIALNTTLVEILGEGLSIYNSERYKQFTKRLGRLIGHCIQYIFDFNELFMQNNFLKDPNMYKRIDVELSAFFLRSCRYIYNSRNVGTWQYFTSLPFSSIPITMTWQIFYLLNVGFIEEEMFVMSEDFEYLCTKDTFLDSFNMMLAGTSNDDMYYLLQTFLEMALAKDWATDRKFIKYICYHVLTIGFINPPTKEICYKISRDIITNMSTTHPDLISHLVNIANTRFPEIDNLIYLFKSLPLNKWIPDEISLGIISAWLLNYSYETNESKIARFIISHLNWNFNSSDNLFLSREIHVRMACLVCEAATKYVPEVIGVSGISKSVRQISNLIDKETTKEQFVSWYWYIISTLRLHYMDQNKVTIKQLLANPAEILKTIPDMKEINIVFQGVTEYRPLSFFLSILLSLSGHSIPLICQKGFIQMQTLLQDYRHAVVIRCLYLVTPLFLECSEILSKCGSFQHLMQMLLNSDRTYMKIAKDFLVADSHGPVLELFGCMLHAQLINYANFGLSSPTPLIILWIECLTNLPNWQNSNVFYLIDIILKIGHQFSDSWWKAKDYFRFYYLSSEDLPRSTVQMLLGTKSHRKIVIPSADYAWLALIILEVEHEIYEVETGLWPELLRQLKLSSNSNFEAVFKKTVSITGGSTQHYSNLVLFKYANIISTINITHHLLPVIAQKFFTLYLSRVIFPTDTRFQNSYGVVDKFYESNISLMKRVKFKLKQVEEYYSNKARVETCKVDDSNDFYTNLSKIYKSYLLWLEETSINTISVNQNIELPPQFNTDKLLLIFNRNEQHWTEYINLSRIRIEQEECALRWLKSCSRLSLGNKSTQILEITKQRTPPIDSILNRLKSYDKPEAPPIFSNKDPILKALTISDVNANMLLSLKTNIHILDEFSKKIQCTAYEMNALNGNYKEYLISLYTNIEYNEKRYARCSSIFSKAILTCANAAEVTITLKTPQKDNNVQRKIEQNRERHKELVGLIIAQNFDPLVIAMEELRHIANYLALFQCDFKKENLNMIQTTTNSIQFFYEIVANTNDNILAFLPTNELFMSLLSIFGVFIKDNQESEGIHLLEIAFKRPELIKICTELFVPAKTRPKYYINMYKFLIDSHMRNCDIQILFVLISKFDLQNWLQSVQPKLVEINRLLELVLKGLESWSNPDASILQGLFRRHLIHIFEFEFPEHYGEVLQAILKSSSDQKLNPAVLIDFLNSLLTRCKCRPLDLNSTQSTALEQIKLFAVKQNILKLKTITDTLILLARHFQTERLQHGLHGLYPKHKNVCKPLALIFTCFGQAAVISAIYTHPGELADQISCMILRPIFEMYSPWLIIYSGQNIKDCTAKWIQQLATTGKVFYPWSEVHENNAITMMQSLVTCLQYMLEVLPVSTSILGHVLSWYSCHFANGDVPSYMRAVTHDAFVQLPWNQFHPNLKNLESFHTILGYRLPECHSFIGFIFLQIPWTTWMNEIFQTWSNDIQSQSISFLFIFFIQISFEPNVHDDIRTSLILNDTLLYPWSDLKCQALESAFNWIITSVDPSIVLKIPSERNDVDSAILKLLKCASDMTSSSENNNFSTQQTRRIIYVRSIVHLLISCKSKYDRLMQTKEGMAIFTDAIIELLSDIDKILIRSANKDAEAVNLFVEIIGPLQTQEENISKLFVEALIIWQSTCCVENNVMSNFLNALGLCTSYTYNIYSLLEASIFNYFKCSDGFLYQHSPTWTSVLERLGNAVDYMNLELVMQGSFFLSLHTFVIHKLRKSIDIEAKISFLQDLIQLLENTKTNEMTESRQAIIWGIIITAGFDILEKNENGKKPLFMLSKYLQTLSTQSLGWSEGLLGVIGLNRNKITNKRKVLARSLACLILSCFMSRTDKSTFDSEFSDSIAELRTITTTKQFSDVKILAENAIEIISNNGLISDENSIAQFIFKLIKLFYNDGFLINICDVWTFKNYT